MRTAVLLGVAAASVYWLTGAHSHQPDLYLRLANAFLHGSLYVAPDAQVELAQGRGGLWYVPFPVLPALIDLPFVAIFGSREPIGHATTSAVGGLAVALSYLLVQRSRAAQWLAVGVATSTLWWVAQEQGTWNMAHVAGLALGMAALLAADRGRFGVAALLVGAAALCRPPMGLLIVPVAAWAWRDGRLMRSLLGLLPAVLVFGIYNAVRFGSPVDSGYAHIPSFFHPGQTVLAESWFRSGLESVSYIPRSIGVMLFQGFTVEPTFPWLRPGVSGLSIAITAPFLLLAVRRENLWLLLAAALVLLPDWMHGSWGFWQFGYRFILDAVPLLLVALGRSYAAGATPWLKVAVVAGALATIYLLYSQRIGFVDGRLPFAY